MGLFSKKDRRAQSQPAPAAPVAPVAAAPVQTPLYERFARSSTSDWTSSISFDARSPSKPWLGDASTSTLQLSSDSSHRLRVPSTSRFAGGSLSRDFDIDRLSDAGHTSSRLSDSGSRPTDSSKRFSDAGNRFGDAGSRFGDAGNRLSEAGRSSSSSSRQSTAQDRPKLAVLTSPPKVVLPSPPTPPDDVPPPALPAKPTRVLAVTSSQSSSQSAADTAAVSVVSGPAPVAKEEEWELVPASSPAAKNSPKKALKGLIASIQPSETASPKKPLRARIKLDTPPDGTPLLSPVIVPTSSQDPIGGTSIIPSVPIQLPSTPKRQQDDVTSTTGSLKTRSSSLDLSDNSVSTPASVARWGRKNVSIDGLPTTSSPNGRVTSAAAFRRAASPAQDVTVHAPRPERLPSVERADVLHMSNSTLELLGDGSGATRGDRRRDPPPLPVPALRSGFASESSTSTAVSSTAEVKFELPPGAAPPVAPSKDTLDLELPPDLAAYATSASLLSLLYTDDASTSAASLSPPVALPPPQAQHQEQQPRQQRQQPQQPPPPPTPAAAHQRGNASFVFVRGAKLVEPDLVPKLGKRRSQLFEDNVPVSVSASTLPRSSSPPPTGLLGRLRSATLGDEDKDKKPRKLSKRVGKTAPSDPASTPPVEPKSAPPTVRHMNILHKEPPFESSSIQRDTVHHQTPQVHHTSAPVHRASGLREHVPSSMSAVSPPRTTVPLPASPRRPTSPALVRDGHSANHPASPPRVAASLQPSANVYRLPAPREIVPLPPSPVAEREVHRALTPLTPPVKKPSPPPTVVVTPSPPSTPEEHWGPSPKARTPSPRTPPDASASVSFRQNVLSMSASHDALSTLPRTMGGSLPTSPSHPALSSMSSSAREDPAAFLAKMRTTSPAVSRRPPVPPMPPSAAPVSSWEPPRFNAGNRTSSAESISSPFFKSMQMAASSGYVDPRHQRASSAGDGSNAKRTGGAAPRILRSAGPSMEEMRMHGRRRSTSNPGRPSPGKRSHLAASSVVPAVPFTYEPTGTYPLLLHLANTELLVQLLSWMDEYKEWHALWHTSRSVRAAVENSREWLLERWLWDVGYRRWAWRVAEPLALTLKDLDAFMMTNDKYGARSYTRVVLRLRMQAEALAAIANVGMNGFGGSRPMSVVSTVSTGGAVRGFRSPLFRPGYAPLLRVFVPSPDAWLSDDSVLACEKELHKAGVVPFLRAGDVVWDSALGSEGNVGKLVWDGSYLIDLDYTFSPLGDIPSYIHSLSLPPAYFHKAIRTGPNPIIHADLSPYASEILAQVRLMQDRHPSDVPVSPTSPQGAVGRWVHRARCHLRGREPIVGAPGLTVDAGWAGTLIIETEGTNEGLAELRERLGVVSRSKRRQSMAEPRKPARTWRLLRERSQPGEIWLRAVTDKDRAQ